MTFKDFSKIAESQGIYTIKNFRGKRIGIDASIKIKQATCGIPAGAHLRGPDGKPTNHVKILFNNIVEFRKYDIEQIWIFDNFVKKSCKASEHQRRSNIREANKERIKSLKLRIEMLSVDDHKESPELETLQKQLISSETANLGNFADEVRDLKHMLNLMGINYIVAPHGIDAEHVGAALSYYNIIDYFITTDPDYLLYAAGLRHVENTKSTFRMLKKIPKKQQYHLYELDTVLTNIDITPKQFILIAICLGVDVISHPDYSTTSGIKGIGAKRVVDIIKGNKKSVNYELQDYHLNAIDVFTYKIPKEAIIIYPEMPLEIDVLQENAQKLEKWLTVTKGFSNSKKVFENIKIITQFDYA